MYDSSAVGYDSGGGISVNTGFGGSQDAAGGASGTSMGGYASGSGQKSSFFSNPSQVSLN